MKKGNQRTILKITLGVLIVMLFGMSTFLVNALISEKSNSLNKKEIGESSNADAKNQLVNIFDDNIVAYGDEDELEEDEIKVSSYNAKITEAEAKKIVAGEVGGIVTKVDTDKIKGRDVWEIEIKKNEKYADILVDMETGEILDIEWEDEEDDD